MAFNPNANGRVYSIAVQTDGKIVAGGQFSSIGGATRNYLARLDGTTGLADSFNPNGSGPSPEPGVYAVVVQADGKILACGRFSTIGGQTRNNIARLDAVTGLADSWNPDAFIGLNGVYSMALQADGKIVVGYAGTTIGGQTRNRIARLDGVTGLADSFDPNANNFVYAIAVQADGKILAGGAFNGANSIGGQTRNFFARLSNDTAALQNLAVTRTAITWTRGGSSPQFARVTFESTTDNVNYTSLGNGTAAGSNWTLTGLSLANGQNLYIRGRGYYRGSFESASESIAESVRNFFVPTPIITSLSPSSKPVGSAAFTLTVNGSNFVNGASVRWNNSARVTTFVSSTQVTAQIPATDLTTAGTVNVTVKNPGTGSATSNSAKFTIKNPVPAISSISPSSATAGGTAFTLTVNGSGFVTTSVVNWNGSARTTTFASSTMVTASISAADIAAAGTVSVTVVNGPPGGGTSNAKTFTINNPVPAIGSISPSSATAGGVAFTLTVNGSGFVTTSVVNWNGAPRTTTFSSSTMVTASISAADIATAGTVSVTVVNGSPGGGTSNAMTFTINNPVPVIGSISPSSATAGGPTFTLTVQGSKFVSGSVVNWNGSARTTTFVSKTKLTASIPAADIATAGTASVTVVNGPPGGGTSNAKTFTINP